MRFANGSIYAQYWRTARGYKVKLQNVGDFWVDKSGSRIYYEIVDGQSPLQRTVLIVNHILPAVLSLHGFLILHGAGIVSDKRAHLFVGPPGLGKSTMASYLNSKGFSVLSDDAVIVKQRGSQFFVGQSPPLIRVWDKARKNKQKEVIQIVQKNTASRWVPLEAVHFPRLVKKMARKGIFKKLTELDGVVALLSQVFRLDLDRRDLQEKEFDAITSLSCSVPMLQWPHSHDKASLARVEKMLVNGVT